MDTRCLPPDLQDGNLVREKPYLRGSAGPAVKEEVFRVTGVGAPISGRCQAEGPALAPVFEGQGWLPGTVLPAEVYEAKGPRPECRAGKSKTPRGHRLLRLEGRAELSAPVSCPASRRPEEQINVPASSSDPKAGRGGTSGRAVRLRETFPWCGV